MPGINPKPGDMLALNGENARHGAAVLRLKKSDVITVCDGAGNDYACVVKKAGKTELITEVCGSSANACEPLVKTRLFLSLLKSDKLEYAVQKAVELGVYAICPFQSENAVARVGGGAADKTARLNKIAEGAAKQSGRGIIPAVESALTFNEALAEVALLKPDIALAAHEGSGVPLKERLHTATGLKTAVIFIGPEGGFSPNEVSLFEQARVDHFSLGRRVLRAETAALAALACLMYELGE